MNLSSFNINGREWTHWAVVFAGTTPYTTLFVDSHHTMARAGVTHQTDGCRRAMA